MIARAEFLEASKKLTALASSYETRTSERLDEITTLDRAIKATRQLAKGYHTDYRTLLSNSLVQTGVTTADHYNNVLNAGLSQKELNKIIEEQIVKQSKQKYYGATLDQRLAASRLMNETRIRKSAYVGATLDTRKLNLSRIFTNSYPFGAQVNLDQRILLGQMVKLEHDLALVIAEKADIKVVKWTLSHRHKKRDICDTYAEAVDKDVVKYLRKEKIKADPKGLYFIKNVPEPPHPNCQCHLTMLDGKKLAGGKVRRTLRRARQLLGNLLQRP